MTGTEFVKEVFADGLSDALRSYAINRLIVKHAQPFRNDCSQGMWSNLPHDQRPSLTHRGGAFHARMDMDTVYKLQKLLDEKIIITTWELKPQDYSPLEEPCGQVTPCIVIDAGRLTESTRRLGRVCGTAIYIPFYRRPN